MRKQTKKRTREKGMLMGPTPFPEIYRMEFMGWMEKNAPEAEFYAIIEADGGAGVHRRMIDMLNQLQIPWRGANVSTAIIIFYNETQNKHMLAGMRLGGIDVNLSEWGPLPGKKSEAADGEPARDSKRG